MFSQTYLARILRITAEMGHLASESTQFEMQEICGLQTNRDDLDFGPNNNLKANDLLTAPAYSAHNSTVIAKCGNEKWLLNAVICSGRNLFIGSKTVGDLFCLLHTYDGVSRSRMVRLALLPSPPPPHLTRHFHLSSAHRRM